MKEIICIALISLPLAYRIMTFNGSIIVLPYNRQTSVGCVQSDGMVCLPFPSSSFVIHLILDDLNLAAFRMMAISFYISQVKNHYFI